MPVVLTEWDQDSLETSNHRPNPNVYEFDLTLWFVLSELCKHSPKDASDFFSLPTSTVLALASASKEQLQRLASGVFIGFRLVTPEDAVMGFLRSDYTPVIQLSDTQGTEFDSAYWLLLKSVGNEYTPEVAATIFDISTELAEVVMSATDNQLRHIAEMTVTAFSLRFDTELVPILMGVNDHTPGRFLQKHQQSISATLTVAKYGQEVIAP